MTTVNWGDPGPVLLNPPDWPKFQNEQISCFAESLNTVLSFGIFPQPLARQLSNYVFTANAVLQDRVRGAGG